ncbi:hypothetical protein [Actinokineospora xionganensis]|uniref:Uncharacterized protein n=1 Tax=Actinokineospora xionganensis TaxID=2684470 RepID=A0ABR7LB63_9PSEU|nr:hypothetical protein [Actinokineospora xionganensis]MBC6449912.1 hypothetical protein [Actinokineospora xionganensis]
MTESRATRFARNVRDALYPNFLPVIAAAMVATRAMGGFWLPVLWGVLAGICAVHLPQNLVVREPAPGFPRALVGYAAPLVGVAVMLAAGVPREVVALTLAMAATLAMTSLVNGSAQVAAWGGLVAMAAVFNLQAQLPIAVAVLVVVGWALVKIGEHSLPRVAMSTVVGPAAGLVVFLVAR